MTMNVFFECGCRRIVAVKVREVEIIWMAPGEHIIASIDFST